MGFFGVLKDIGTVVGGTVIGAATGGVGGAVIGGVSAIGSVTSGTDTSAVQGELGAALNGQVCPGPFNVDAVFAAIEASPLNHRSQLLSFARKIPGFAAAVPNPTNILLARALVATANGCLRQCTDIVCQQTQFALSDTLATFGQVGNTADIGTGPVRQTPAQEAETQNILDRVGDALTVFFGGGGDTGATTPAPASQPATGAGGIPTGLVLAGGGALLFFALRRDN